MERCRSVHWRALVRRRARRWRVDLAAAGGPGACRWTSTVRSRGTSAPRRPARRPLELAGFTGRVTHGASCNCRSSRSPRMQWHAHRVRRPPDARARGRLPRAPAGSSRAAVTVEPEAAGSTRESTDPAPHARDLLITRRALEARLAPRCAFEARALSCARSQPSAKRTRDYSGQAPPFLSREAAQLLVERGIEHLVVDVPSPIASSDAGRLTAHRIFFGLPPGATALRGRHAPGCDRHRAGLRPRRPRRRLVPARAAGAGPRRRRGAEPPGAVRAERPHERSRTLERCPGARCRRPAAPAARALRAARARRSARRSLYLCGHSLGLQPLAARALVDAGAR